MSVKYFGYGLVGEPGPMGREVTYKDSQALMAESRWWVQWPSQ